MGKPVDTISQGPDHGRQIFIKVDNVYLVAEEGHVLVAMGEGQTAMVFNVDLAWGGGGGVRAWLRVGPCVVGHLPNFTPLYAGLSQPVA
jgi:hypothetical protein